MMAPQPARMPSESTVPATADAALDRAAKCLMDAEVAAISGDSAGAHVLNEIADRWLRLADTMRYLQSPPISCPVSSIVPPAAAPSAAEAFIPAATPPAGDVLAAQ